LLQIMMMSHMFWPLNVFIWLIFFIVCR
jgi:hypothetical protein